MPGCIFRASGEDFEIDRFLARSGLRPSRTHHRGDVGIRARPLAESGFILKVSDADGCLPAEIADTIQFLSANEGELEKLRDFPGVTDMRLDFGIYRRDVAAQVDYFPPDLLARAGRLGIGIELSIYAAGEPV